MESNLFFLPRQKNKTARLDKKGLLLGVFCLREREREICPRSTVVLIKISARFS